MSVRGVKPLTTKPPVRSKLFNSQNLGQMFQQSATCEADGRIEARLRTYKLFLIAAFFCCVLFFRAEYALFAFRVLDMLHYKAATERTGTQKGNLSFAGK